MSYSSLVKESSYQLSSELENGILEAEGELNREVQKSLNQFRIKLTQNLNSRIDKKTHVDTYDISKDGPQKNFKFRESLLTLMFNVRDIKTLYNMAVASFAVLTFCLLYDSYTQKGEFIDHRQFFKVFLGWETIFIGWWILSILHFSIILVTKVALNCSSYIWMPLYIIHILSICYCCFYISQSSTLGFGSVVIIMSEGTRMIMKSHSYFRTKMLYCQPNAYQQFMTNGISINDVKNQKSQKLVINMKDIFMEVKRLSFFFIAPTLIYRDEYTLTPVRKMSVIIVHFINFFLCTYYAFMLYVMNCKGIIENLQKTLNFNTFVLTVIRLMLPSVCFLILGFFGFLHSWLNGWAEITRFPDRAFYSDWWNSIEFGSYYRKWNIVVHDWLYYYVYLDLSRFFKICNKKKIIPKLLTFLFSAIVHEVIVCIAIGFFYPILFLLFTGPGIILIQNQKNLKIISINLIFWIEMYIGTAMLFSFYLVESFARKQVNDQFMTQKWGSIMFLIPRTYYLGLNNSK